MAMALSPRLACLSQAKAFRAAGHVLSAAHDRSVTVCREATTVHERAVHLSIGAYADAVAPRSGETLRLRALRALSTTAPSACREGFDVQLLKSYRTAGASQKAQAMS